jgi:predicted ABC-type transport system involved in lysophospholipase L1 biosynthesis ATPase subunit
LILVTHDEAIAERCGRVLKLRGGHLAEDSGRRAGVLTSA